MNLELDVTDLNQSLAFYAELGFRILFNWPEDRFAYLDRSGVRLVLEVSAKPIAQSNAHDESLLIEVVDVDALYARAQAGGFDVTVPLEERWYRQDAIENGTRQFVVVDPDGYLLRFFTNLGQRPVSDTIAQARAGFADLSSEAVENLIDEAGSAVRKPQ